MLEPLGTMDVRARRGGMCADEAQISRLKARFQGMASCTSEPDTRQGHAWPMWRRCFALYGACISGVRALDAVTLCFWPTAFLAL